ncbi:3-keto-disaccharide hydrolase [Flavobacterium reichenbachii]|uniref:3-keto-alpha-glucoside-1,2-lyase/3-keto-2-hydroxy-glucal hydratase domain-containing protein n=1 Tax=Flavobacterium reichenbachii TaxID=362418 RepID=A0A085ZFY5_9FLAO|nr:DUF1080 domain-containing protein [Flavobacterium reichenbachii]KFF03349.1 hypothetical protein IW19_20895 [Flavobacterium reichenbachii]OXB16714.1 large multifunctional protein- glycosyl hydrolase [Flavobacterium reichenbachii]
MNHKFKTKLLQHLPSCFLLLIFFTSQINVYGMAVASPLEGRWDITIDIDGKPAPAWLEVRLSGHKTLVGQFVCVVGSGRPVSEIHFKDGKFSFAIPAQWEQGTNDLRVEGVIEGEKIFGTLITVDEKKQSWTGVRAPVLRRTSPPVWGKSIRLIENNSLNGWHAEGNNNQWISENGILRSPKSGVNLVTNNKFTDFKLHVEFRIPKGSNSGIYLRGRYEVQVTDSKGMEPALDQMGAIYGFLVPNEMVAKEAGEWNTFDITLIGKMVTIVANGKTVISNQDIPGITGGAIDSNEGEPGPLLIQGDHGPVEYRNIIITPAK